MCFCYYGNTKHILCLLSLLKNFQHDQWIYILTDFSDYLHRHWILNQQIFSKIVETHKTVSVVVSFIYSKIPLLMSIYFIEVWHFVVLFPGAPFKPSAKKGHKEVEFAPTNLHIHRVWIQNDAIKGVSKYTI